MTTKKATSRDRKKATAKKTGRKATAKAKAKDDRKANNDGEGRRSGLVNVPDPQTGKALRRLLRKAGIYLSKDPSIGQVPVKVVDGMAIVQVNGEEIRTAVRS